MCARWASKAWKACKDQLKWQVEKEDWIDSMLGVWVRLTGINLAFIIEWNPMYIWWIEHVHVSLCEFAWCTCAPVRPGFHNIYWIILGTLTKCWCKTTGKLPSSIRLILMIPKSWKNSKHSRIASLPQVVQSSCNFPFVGLYQKKTFWRDPETVQNELWNKHCSTVPTLTH